MNELEELFNAMFDNKVSELWSKVSYPSLKPLGSWIIDFFKRFGHSIQNNRIAHLCEAQF